jgi:ankyrin repeat protein
MSFLDLPNEMIIKIAKHLKDDHDPKCNTWHRHVRYGDFNQLLQAHSQFYDVLNPILWKEAVQCPRNTTPRIIAHLIRLDGLTRLEQFLHEGANVDTGLPGFFRTGTHDDSTIDFPTPLVATAALDNVPLARLLLNNGAKIQYSLYVDDAKYCPIHATRSAQMVQLLIDYGSDINLVDSEGLTPLHWFARRGNLEAMRAVLLHGANVDAIGGIFDYDSDGFGLVEPNGIGRRTPLHEAVQRGHVGAVTMLLEFGADASMEDETSRLALNIAIEIDNSEIVRILLQNYPEAVLAKIDDSRSPFHQAAFTGNLRIMWILLDCWPEGAQQRDHWSEIPLHVAARFKHTELVKVLVNCWPQGLMEKNYKNDTPLHVAADVGDSAMVGFLAEIWPEAKSKRNKEGRTPIAVFLDRLNRLDKFRSREEQAEAEKILSFL